MTRFEEAMTVVIQAVDSFLRSTGKDPTDASAATLQDLSRKIETARRSRLVEAADSSCEDCSIREAYRSRLESLRSRLGETERALREKERELTKDSERLTLVQEWHNQFTATQ